VCYSDLHEQQTTATSLNIHFVDLATGGLAAGVSIAFTFRWANGQWEGRNFQLTVM